MKWRVTLRKIRNAPGGGGSPSRMGQQRTTGRFLALSLEPQGPSLEEELEEAADLLSQQEPPSERQHPFRPPSPDLGDECNPALIDPAD